MSWYFDLAPHLNLWNRIRTEKKKKKETRSESLSLQSLKQSRMPSFTIISSSIRQFVFYDQPIHGKGVKTFHVSLHLSTSEFASASFLVSVDCSLQET